MEGTKNRIGTSGRVEVLSLPASNLFAGLSEPASLSYFLMRLARGFLCGLHQARDP